MFDAMHALDLIFSVDDKQTWCGSIDKKALSD
jgi:hypothetical protein